MRSRWVSILAGALCALPAAAFAGESARADDVEELKRQNREILERLAEAEKANEDLRRRLEGLESPAAAAAAENPSAVSAAIDAYLAKAENGAAFGEVTKSGKPLRFYGFFRLDAYYNTARMNNVYVPFWAISEDAVDHDDDEVFTLDPELTRIGLEIDGGTVGDARVTAHLQTDFANSVSGASESREFLRLRLAYVDLAFDGFSIRFGQDWDVHSPLLPSVSGQTALWNVGNLGDRRPQIAFRANGGDAEGFAWTGALALGLTSAVDNLDLDDDGERDGFDAGRPGLAGRFGVAFPGLADRRIEIGVSGHVAWMETATLVGGEDEFQAWSASLDFVIPLLKTLTLRGELFTGQALADVRGGIGQSVNTDEGKEISSRGGWIELGWQASESFAAFLGAGMDEPDEDDLMSGARKRNQVIYVAGRMDFGGGLKTGLEVLFWETEWVGMADGDLVRVCVYCQYDW